MYYDTALSLLWQVRASINELLTTLLVTRQKNSVVAIGTYILRRKRRQSKKRSDDIQSADLLSWISLPAITSVDVTDALRRQS